MSKNKSNFQGVLIGYIELFKYLFSYHKITHLLNVPLSTNMIIVILGSIGVLRNVMEYYIAGKLARGWFLLTPDVFLTMFIFPIFLCFFATTLLHFFSNRLNLNVKIKEILSVLFFLQIVHLIIPFFDGLAPICHNLLYVDFRCLPIIFNIPELLYIKLIFSPLALTPFILFVTTYSSLGIALAWMFVGFILIKLYLKHFKFPVIKSVLALSITFYIVYLCVYVLYHFFINEVILGSNYMYGLFFVFMSIPSVMYVKMLLKEKITKKVTKL